MIPEPLYSQCLAVGVCGECVDDLDYTPHREASIMTLALAFIGKDSIVMATDSAKTYISNMGKIKRTVLSPKLYKLDEHTGMMLVSEQAGISEWMIRTFDLGLSKQKGIHSYDDMVNVFTQFAQQYWGLYTKAVPYNLFRDKASQITFILCGYNSKSKPTIIQSISVSTPTIFAPDVVDNYCALGCSDEAEYWIRKLDKAHTSIRQMSAKALQYLCLFLIRETSERLPELVQEPMQMLTITKKEGVKLATNKEIKELARTIKALSNTNKVIETLKQMED